MSGEFNYCLNKIKQEGISLLKVHTYEEDSAIFRYFGVDDNNNLTWFDEYTKMTITILDISKMVSIDLY